MDLKIDPNGPALKWSASDYYNRKNLSLTKGQFILMVINALISILSVSVAVWAVSTQIDIRDSIKDTLQLQRELIPTVITYKMSSSPFVVAGQLPSELMERL